MKPVKYAFDETNKIDLGTGEPALYLEQSEEITV